MKKMVLVGAMMALVGCGGGDGGGPTAPSAPPAPQTFTETHQDTVPAYPGTDLLGTSVFMATPERNANVTLTLEWSDSSADLDMYVLLPGCDFTTGANCTILAEASGTARPERVNLQVHAGQTLMMAVQNYTNIREVAYSLRTDGSYNSTAPAFSVGGFTSWMTKAEVLKGVALR